MIAQVAAVRRGAIMILSEGGPQRPPGPRVRGGAPVGTRPSREARCRRARLGVGRAPPSATSPSSTTPSSAARRGL
jgi:hypothetical protein